MVPGADPAAAADLLFAFAETEYKEYFPSRQRNRTLAGWVYRYYPESGAYLAVIDWRVYVMSGPFGPEVRDVGAVTDFVTVPGASALITATKLGKCPPASVIEAPNYYTCMNGTLVGTQVFDTSKACQLSISSDGVFTVESGQQRVSLTAAQTGRVLYTRTTGGSYSYLSASIYSADAIKPYSSIDFDTTPISGRDFFTLGGELIVSVRQLFPEASLSCRFDVPRT